MFNYSLDGKPKEQKQEAEPSALPSEAPSPQPAEPIPEEEPVPAAKGSRFAAVAGWRPSLPSFKMGSSELGMRAREALSVLDAILEENDTDDIPKGFIVGLGGLAALLGLIALLVVLFG